jgi:hypothetical protein
MIKTIKYIKFQVVRIDLFVRDANSRGPNHGYHGQVMVNSSVAS